MNSIFFFIPFLLIAGVGIYQDSFATEEFRGYDYSVVKNFDGSYTKTFGLQPYIYNNVTNTYLPFINNGLVTETEHGSVELNADGSYSYYSNGLIVNGTTPKFTDTIRAKYADVSDLSSWTYPNSLNNDLPDNTWSNNGFNSTRYKSGVGQLTYQYIINDGKWKTQLEATNLSGLNTKAFGFDQIIDLNSDQIKFGDTVRNLDNFDGQEFSKTFLDNNKGKVIDLMNGFYFDFDLAYDNLHSVTVYDTGANKSRLVFDFRTDTALLPNKTLILDPTFGYAQDTSYYVSDNLVTSASCGGTPTTKSANAGIIQLRPSDAFENCYRSGYQFDLGLPSTAVVTDSDIRFDITSSLNPINCDLRVLTSEIVAASATTLWSEIASGTALFTNNNFCAQIVANNYLLDLGATGDTQVQSAISNGRIGLGVKATTETRIAGNYQTMNVQNMELLVTYNLPPDPPKLMNATVAVTGVTNNWSAPAQNGGTGSIVYYLQRGTSGAGYTTFATQPDTSNTDTQPIFGNYLYYRAYSSDSLGLSPGYSFPVNSTVADNVLTHLPYDYTLTDQGKEGNTPTVTGGELYASGHNGGARSFDGISYDTLANEADYDFERTSPFSVSFWSKVPATSCVGASNEGVITKLTNFDQRGWGITCEFNTFYFKLQNTYDTNNIIIHPTTAANDNTYRHWVFTYDGSSVGSNVEVYLDGELKAKTVDRNTLSATILQNNALTMGGMTAGGKFTGSIDDIRIFNIELTAHDVEQLYYERLDRSVLMIFPYAVTDLTATPTVLATVDLDWTTPSYSYAPIIGYMINYTTPWGDPVTILDADTGTTDTAATIENLVVSQDYSFRVSPVTIIGTNSSGNIANVTTDTQFVPGDISNPDITNTDDFKIFFERGDINATSLWLNVTYPDTYDLNCNFFYQFARINDTYANLTSTAVIDDDGNNVESAFEMINYTGDNIHVRCYDTITADEAKYVITITDFPFLQQIDNLRNGTYGTAFQFGAVDGITLIVVILGMIGFNRINPVAGIVFTVMTTGVLAYFGIISLMTIIFPVLAAIVLWAYMTTRKDD